jgi:hypothetical protein
MLEVRLNFEPPIITDEFSFAKEGCPGTLRLGRFRLFFGQTDDT